MANIVNQLWNDFVSMVFPVNCVGCNCLLVKGEQHLCSICRLNLPVADDQTKKQRLLNLFSHNPKISYVDAYLLFKKAGLTQKLLHELKYRGNYEVGHMLGAWFASQLIESQLFQSFDMLIPVPLHKRKLRLRGYNQSQAIAEGMQATSGKPMKTDILQRAKFTTTQTRKRKLERWENMEHIFEVVRPELILGKKVILIDDVLTTGSTLASCAEELEKNGATEIGICALALALK